VQDYGFRLYNPGLSRFFSVDPLTESYPWYTPYQFAGNMPITSIDLDGLEPKSAVQDWVRTAGFIFYGNDFYGVGTGALLKVENWYVVVQQVVDNDRNVSNRYLYWTGKENTSKGTWKEFPTIASSHGNTMNEMANVARRFYKTTAAIALIAGGVYAAYGSGGALAKEGISGMALGFNMLGFQSSLLSVGAGGAKLTAYASGDSDLSSKADNLPTCMTDAIIGLGYQGVYRSMYGKDPENLAAVRGGLNLLEIGSALAYARWDAAELLKKGEIDKMPPLFNLDKTDDALNLYNIVCPESTDWISPIPVLGTKMRETYNEISTPTQTKKPE
jgi:hypothetical protein